MTVPQSGRRIGHVRSRSVPGRAVRGRSPRRSRGGSRRRSHGDRGSIVASLAARRRRRSRSRGHRRGSARPWPRGWASTAVMNGRVRARRSAGGDRSRPVPSPRAIIAAPAHANREGARSATALLRLLVPRRGASPSASSGAAARASAHLAAALERPCAVLAPSDRAARGGRRRAYVKAVNPPRGRSELAPERGVPRRHPRRLS